MTNYVWATRQLDLFVAPGTSGCPKGIQFYSDVMVAFPAATPDTAEAKITNAQYNGVPAIHYT